VTSACSHNDRTWVGRVALAAALLGAGCEDKAACDNAVATTRKAIEVKDFNAARQWRDFTWKACGDDAIRATIDKELTDAINADRALAAETKKRTEQEAQKRINAAQKHWHDFAALPAAQRTQAALDQTLERARAEASGLPPELAEQIVRYNQQQYESARAKLAK